MGQEYSNPERATDKYALPDIEVFQLTAREVAEMDEDLVWEYMHKHEFRLASMNSRTRDLMFNAMIDEQSIEGGYFYWYCFPGCLPEGSPMGPYKTYKEALEAAQDEATE